jgi:hypothetical protein
MRTTKELLTIVSENMDKFRTGLCALIGRLEWDGTIGPDEYDHLIEYLKKHRPFNMYYINGDAYYWKQKESKPRKRWLKKHIKRNK